MFLLIPYQTDVPMDRWPLSNFALLVLIAGVSIYGWADDAFFRTVVSESTGYGLHGLVGHVFLHADFVHLMGNLLFLWLFGNAVCAKVGNLIYPLVFVGLGALAGVAHNLLDGSPAIGASGAINGVVGVYLILYPLNTIRVIWVFMVRGGEFETSSIKMILLWFAFDVWGASTGAGGVAYWAHLGGFAAGAALGLAALRSGWVRMDERLEKTLPQVLGDRYDTFHWLVGDRRA